RWWQNETRPRNLSYNGMERLRSRLPVLVEIQRFAGDAGVNLGRRVFDDRRGRALELEAHQAAETADEDENNGERSGGDAASTGRSAYDGRRSAMRKSC